jgi:hypothetical protein
MQYYCLLDNFKIDSFKRSEKVKKIIWVFFVLLIVIAFPSCKSKPPKSEGMPFYASIARRDAPEDVLVGIGNAKMATLAQSRSIAATRARAEISNSMNTMVRSMVRDYTASSEVDPSAALAFQENITVTLSKSDLSGSVIYWEGSDDDGQRWCVVHLSKANVVKEISQAQAAARLVVPAMASFDAEQRMNEAFKQAKEEDL